MKFTASVVFALFSAATLVSGNPVPEAGAAEHDVSLEVRGHGCPWSSNQCAFHCRNDVRKNCPHSNKVLKPSGGTCGGLGWATCKCIYDKNC